MEKKHSILIASFDPKIREMGRSAAEAEGYPSILCGDGAEALDSAKNAGDSIRLIVMEAFLPKVDGFEVARQLEEFPRMGNACGDIRPGLRCLAEGSYLIFYRVLPQKIHILRILHAARDLEKQSFDS